MSTGPEPSASQREVDQLRAELHRLDDHGSRGVGALQVQLTDLVRDMAEIKTEVNGRFDAHQRVHDQDRHDRIAARRWLIGTGIAGLATAAAMITMLWDVLQHVHGLTRGRRWSSSTTAHSRT